MTNNYREAIRQLYLAMLMSQDWRYQTRPANAAHSQLAGAAGANAKGAYVDLLAINTITTTFWIVGLHLSNLSAADVAHVDIASLVGVVNADLVSNLPYRRGAADLVVGQLIYLPRWIRQPANNGVSCRAATVGGGADTMDAAVLLATHAALNI